MQIGEIEAVCHISDNGHFAGDVINNPRELTRWALSIHRSKRLVVRDCCYVMDAIKRGRMRVRQRNMPRSPRPRDVAAEKCNLRQADLLNEVLLNDVGRGSRPVLQGWRVL
jgi:hypothetical protein